MVDDTVDDPDRCEREFTLECKRLGTPRKVTGEPSSDWILNKNYIEKGVRRFLIHDHGYGPDDESGMVGYVQDMELDDILLEVNTHATTVAVPNIDPPSQGWQETGISRLSHTLDRSFGKSPFLLNHFWIDLRDYYKKQD